MPSSDVPWYLTEDGTRSYESKFEGKGKRYDLLEKELLRRLIGYLGEPKTMIEVGAGTAHFTRWFESLGIKCVGLDFSTPMLMEAKKHWDGDLIRADAHNLPLRSKTFDLVTLISCMELMRNPREVLNEACRVSKLGILWGMLNKWSLPALHRMIYAKLGKSLHVGKRRYYSITGADKLLRNALGKIAYTTRWATAVHPRFFPEISSLPFGAFLAIAVKFSDSEAEYGVKKPTT
jgi:2-polyprenyl-3-methyl-5-hydroxy-6-metoxy-1,4-benzoquinol methylase